MVNCNSFGFIHREFFLLGIWYLIGYTESQTPADLFLTIPQGTLQGGIWTTHRGRNILAFSGIPYGQPPIGNLRFANPVAAGGWSGIRNASTVGTKCTQYSSSHGIEGDEDCLHISVYTPRLPDNVNSSLLPVMFYVSGGGFISGGTMINLQNPHFLLDDDVILVIPNYRVGALGFLSTGDEVASGNWALKDLVLALQWVQSNIGYFGGDKDRATIFGVSAGSTLVHLLTLYNGTEGLFHNYITSSGSALGPWAHQPRARYVERASQLGEYVGCFNDTSESLIECLRTVDVSEIAATLPRFCIWATHPQVIWTPTDEPDIDGAVLTDSPANLFAAGKIRDLPWISGITRDEGLYSSSGFYTNAELLEEFLANFDSLLPEMLAITHMSDGGAAWVKALKSYYLDDDLTGNASVIVPKLTRLFGDAMFIYPAYSALKKHHQIAKNPQYFYTFNYEGTFSATYFQTGNTNHYGVAHGDDMTYIFLRTGYFAGHGGNMSETDLEMVDMMVPLRTSFAANGVPTSSALDNATGWTPYSSEDNYLRIGNDTDIEPKMENSFLVERMKFWEDFEAATSNPSLNNASNVLRAPSILLSAFLLFCSQLIPSGKTFVS